MEAETTTESLPPPPAENDDAAAAPPAPAAPPSSNDDETKEDSPEPNTDRNVAATSGGTEGESSEGAADPSTTTKEKGGDAKDDAKDGTAVAPPSKDNDADNEDNEEEAAVGTESPPPDEADAPKKKGRRGRPTGTSTPSTTPAKRAAEEPEGTSPAPGGVGREKRARKASQTYRPEDFTKIDHSVEIHPGRGKTLEGLDAVKASIELYCKSDPHLAERAHKFVFGGQRKPLKADIQPNLMAFSGYLPPVPEGIDEKELEAMDKKIEAKMGERAFKLKVGDVKELCDFFALDRSGLTGKDDLIDCLLDFLSEPSNEHVKEVSKGSSRSRSRSNHTQSTSPPTKKRSSKGGGGGGKSSAKATKKRGRSKQRKKDDASDESESEANGDDPDEGDEHSADKEQDDDEIDLLQTKQGNMPNDATLRKWVNCFVQCYDLDKASVKVALTVAGEKFGVNLAEKKELLKQMLTEAMT